MLGDEALREALVELKSLREREAEALRASTAMLDGLSAITGTDRPDEAVGRLLVSVQKSLGCDQVVLVRDDGAGPLVAEAVDPALADR
ncbi:MAG: hypothetical protein AAFV86_12830, partial [Pseudomonadota bacterium]